MKSQCRRYKVHACCLLQSCSDRGKEQEIPCWNQGWLRTSLCFAGLYSALEASWDIKEIVESIMSIIQHLLPCVYSWMYVYGFIGVHVHVYIFFCVCMHLCACVCMCLYSILETNGWWQVSSWMACHYIVWVKDLSESEACWFSYACWTVIP